MKLLEIEWRNIGPFGNKLQHIEFGKEGGLWMVTGKNGNGKCLTKDTKLNVHIKDPKLRKEFEKFLRG